MLGLVAAAVSPVVAACGVGAMTGPTAPQTFALGGSVHATGTDGPAVVGASVRVLEGSVADNPTLTDAGGAFYFPTLGLGLHLIEVSKTGFAIWETEIIVVDRNVQLAVMLKATAASTSAAAALGPSLTRRSDDHR
jgi:hypothetical protein